MAAAAASLPVNQPAEGGREIPQSTVTASAVTMGLRRKSPSFENTERLVASSLLLAMSAGSPPSSRRPSNVEELDWKVRLLCCNFRLLEHF